MASVNDVQWTFFQNLGTFLSFVRDHLPNLWTCRGRTLWRDPKLQLLYDFQDELCGTKQITNTQESQHELGLAIDIDFFYDGDYIREPTAEQQTTLFHLGEFWKSLHPQNKYGGDWPRLRDWGHFEMRVED